MATSTKFYDDADSFAAVAEILPGVTEPGVPIYFQGALVGGVNYQAIELFDRTPDGSGYPGTLADLVANTFLRVTYQKPDGTAGPYGTSFAATFSGRTAAGDLAYVPTVDRAEISIGGGARYTDFVSGHFGTFATTTSTRTFPDPAVGLTTAGISNVFTVQRDLELATGPARTKGDVLRAGTLSTMFASQLHFDASLILWDDPAGNVHSLQLGNATPRDNHLFEQAQELGSWVELVKGAGSAWFPDSPTIRLMIENPHGLHLGLQGFLASSQNPNDDSLSVWTELLGPPGTLSQDTTYRVDFVLVAVPPLTDHTTYVTPFSAKLVGTPFNNVTLSGTADIDAVGTGGNNVLKGNSGANTLNGGAGNDTLDGGSGTDTAVFSGNRSQYSLARTGETYSVQDNAGTDGLTTLTNVERFQFADENVALDVANGKAGTTAKILGLVFGPSSVANKIFVGIGLELLDGGMSYSDLMALALTAKLGSHFSNSAEVGLLYQNLFGHGPTAAESAFWSSVIDAGQFSQASLAIAAAELDINAANVNLVGLAETGLEYLPQG